MDKQYTASSEAYELYLKGRSYWNKRTPGDFPGTARSERRRAHVAGKGL
jgi:hypothetical protein